MNFSHKDVAKNTRVLLTIVVCMYRSCNKIISDPYEWIFKAVNRTDVKHVSDAYRDKSGAHEDGMKDIQRVAANGNDGKAKPKGGDEEKNAIHQSDIKWKKKRDIQEVAAQGEGVKRRQCEHSKR